MRLVVMSRQYNRCSEAGPRQTSASGGSWKLPHSNFRVVVTFSVLSVAAFHCFRVELGHPLASCIFPSTCDCVFNVGLDLGAEHCDALRQPTPRTVHLPHRRLAWPSSLAD